ncbi:MAG: HAMP domain-containing histidine kinase [Patescibacteria group bacterium]|nr:HAMP domain-containing histidine kinase [Patescibacteria group bacterium]
MRLFDRLYFVVKPSSIDKDSARREFILNILLVGSSSLSFVAFLHNLITHIANLESDNAVAPIGAFVIFAYFAFLFFLSKKGKFIISAYLLVIIYALVPAYTSYIWGSDVPQALMMYPLLVVMAGILISTRFALLVTLITGAGLITLNVLEINKVHVPSSYWKLLPNTLGDTVLSVATLAVIAVVSWLFNREIEKALERAQASEEALRKERDLLEIKVEERTRELKQMQMEKIAQLYRFAEFGRLTSGLFHGLANPLNLISLNLEQLSTKNKDEFTDARILLNRAITGTKRMEQFIAAAKKQIQNQEVNRVFSIRNEVNDTLSMLEYKAKKCGVAIDFSSRSDVKIKGNPLRFNQLLTNLVLNAIDSYETINSRGKNKVEITFVKNSKEIELKVQDWGIGIPKENIKKIFDPFFTTKNFDRGTGVGLSICQEIIQKSFNGNLSVVSQEGVGSTFIITIPIKR